MRGRSGAGAPDRSCTGGRETDSVTRMMMLALATSLIAGRKPDGPLGTVGAIVTAPVTVPVMFVSARLNDDEGHLERARRNHRALPPIDAESGEMARATLEQALARGRIDEGALLAERRRCKRVCGGWRHRARNRADRRRTSVPGSAHRDHDGAPADGPVRADLLPARRGLERFCEHPGMRGEGGTRIARTDTEWVIRQGFACVWVQAPNSDDAIEIAAKRLGHMGAWKVGPGVDQEVFAAEEYREHAQPGDYTRSVIVRPPSRRDLRWAKRKKGTCR